MLFLRTHPRVPEKTTKMSLLPTPAVRLQRTALTSVYQLPLFLETELLFSIDNLPPTQWVVMKLLLPRLQ